MSDATDPNNQQARWHENNTAYLSAALRWLRLRLEQAAAGPTELPTVPNVIEPSSEAADAMPVGGASLAGRFFGRRNGHHSSAIASVQTPSPGATSILRVLEQNKWREGALQMAEAEMEERASGEFTPALVVLAERLSLSKFEGQVLLLCAAMELDTRIAPLCARAQDDAARAYPTFALAMAALDEPAWDALTPNGPLRYWRLVEMNQPGAMALTASALRADERVVSYLKGLNRLDDRLALLFEPTQSWQVGGVTGVDGAALPPSQQALAERIVRRVTSDVTHRQGGPPVVALAGPDGASKQAIAAKVAQALGLSLCVLPLEAVPTQPNELETLVRLWERESLLLPLALYVDAHELDRASEQSDKPRYAALRRLLARGGGLMFVDTRDSMPGLVEREALALDVDKPTALEQREIWQTLLGKRERAQAERLAGQFNLSAPSIRSIVREVRAEADAGANAASDLAWRASLGHTRPRLEALAQRIAPKATLEALVLPEREKKKLGQIVEQVRWRNKVYDEFGLRETTNRGLGISALFAGESGTGKTTAAEAIAIALHLNLYRIDLSAVVSKYIGETEKNLRRVFDAAEDGGAILLFDEADALFGKRSEVKDSHDRYANIEIGYLLQRMEAYNGLAILTTNMKSALDAAFVRRLRFIVDFPFPGLSERKQMWQRAFPPHVPLHADLDLDRLGRFNLSGGSIHNAAVQAAFMAAAQPVCTLTMAMAVEAAQDELLKLNRPMQVV